MGDARARALPFAVTLMKSLLFIMRPPVHRLFDAGIVTRTRDAPGTALL
jgi:hypothetical protein